MFGRLMPKEEKFFDLFNQHAEFCVKGARELLELMKDFSHIERRLHAIEGLEKQAAFCPHCADFQWYSTR